MLCRRYDEKLCLKEALSDSYVTLWRNVKICGDSKRPCMLTPHVQRRITGGCNHD
jgi:hypothetical protein